MTEAAVIMPTCRCSVSADKLYGAPSLITFIVSLDFHMRVVVWITLVLAVAAYICGQLVDPDLWWHITIGRWIVAHGAVPHVDYWTHFGNGEPWRAYSWSIEVMFALIEGAFGLTGLFVAKMTMTAMLAFSAQYVFSKLSGSLGLGSLLTVVFTASCYNHITLRPQTFI